MIQLTASGDKYFTSKIEPVISHTEPNSHDDNHPSFHRLLAKLNIPINCFHNQQIRQHYLEEYNAKYSKAKHLLSNARKKQRKIIITYYEEKEKQHNINELQIVKESLLEENEKIKRFKEALKDKLIIYQQRIQFLKNTEFWSTLKTQQLQNESIQTDTENSSPDLPTKNNSCHQLHDDERIKYSDNHLDDSCPTISDEYHFERKSNQDDNLTDIPSKHREQLHPEFISEIGENIENSISKGKSNGYFSWLKNCYRLLFMFTLNGQYDRFKIISTILIISLAIFLVIFVNDLLEQFLIYLTKPSRSISTLSPSNSMIKTFFTYLLCTIYNYMTSWLLTIARLFEYSA